MRISWRFSAFALLAVASPLLGGCGGISASRTISPLDFLLPGIIRAEPPPTNAPVIVLNHSVQIASAR